MAKVSSILGAFVFGFDYENKEVFEQTYEFIVKGRLDCVQLRILHPLPGTRLYHASLTAKAGCLSLTGGCGAILLIPSCINRRA